MPISATPLNFAFAGPGPARGNGRSVAVIGPGRRPCRRRVPGLLGYQVDVYDKLPSRAGLWFSASRPSASRRAHRGRVEVLAGRYGCASSRHEDLRPQAGVNTGDELSTR
jgi:hypothetical protein